MKKVELLSPAGSFEKLKYALAYGADAVYAGVRNFSLRASGMGISEIEKSIHYVKERRKKIYLALNIFAENSDFVRLKKVLKKLNTMEPDAFIIADPGFFKFVKENSQVPIHLSTQANVTNYLSAGFWKEAGAKRITLARELSLKSLKEISKKTDIKTEVLIHGAMCISYSGRCLLSHYLDGRNANRGECAQPCRWSYYLNEEKSTGEFLPVTQYERGSFIISSKDLCLIKRIPQLIESGVKGLKIEGRMKSIHYVSAVTKVYRQAIDSYYENRRGYEVRESWINELLKVSHRPYSEGFLFDDYGQLEGHQSYIKEAEFVGQVASKSDGRCTINVKNKLQSGELLDVLTPQGDNFNWKIEEMVDSSSGQRVSTAHANFTVLVEGNLPLFSLLRRSNDYKTNAK